MKCTHDNVTFVGLYSLIGNYHCNDCGEVIEPVIYHQMKKMPHVRLDSNNNIIESKNGTVAQLADAQLSKS